MLTTTDPSNPTALATHYAHLAKVARIISAALVSRASHNAAQGRRFLTDHRMLVAHTLKRSAGIGHVEDGLSESVAELADSFIVMIVATGFLEVSFPYCPRFVSSPWLYLSGRGGRRQRGRG